MEVERPTVYKYIYFQIFTFSINFVEAKTSLGVLIVHISTYCKITVTYVIRNNFGTCVLDGSQTRKVYYVYYALLIRPVGLSSRVMGFTSNGR